MDELLMRQPMAILRTNDDVPHAPYVVQLPKVGQLDMRVCN